MSLSFRKHTWLASTAFSLALFGATAGYANPIGGSVTVGQASIAQTGAHLDVTQNTDKVLIDWRGFDIAPNETTQFHQPGSGSLVVNRVNSTSASQIDGALTANGNIVIINQNGIVFGNSAKVDVNGLVATTADGSNNDLLGSQMHFTKPGNPDASVVNRGTITAKDAGLVGLVAPNVENSGVINAKLGHVALASGDTATIDMYGDGLLQLAVSDNVTSQSITHSGTINAAGGTVALTAAAGKNIVNSLVTVSGEINAPTFSEKDGKIIIAAEGSNAVTGNVSSNKSTKQGVSTVLVSGKLNASGKGTGQKGGNITVTADNVGILSGALLDTSGRLGGGDILIGGDFHGAGTTATASNTVVQDGAVLNASALDNGNGGSVVVWSDKVTDFAGSIATTGGLIGGNGGQVETSGKSYLSATGLVNASAAHGLAGNWLLDPNNITIQATGSDTNISGNPIFGSTNNSAILTTTSINTALNSGTSVTVQTNSLGTNSQLGDITINGAIAKTAGGDATLTFKAANDIKVTSGKTITSTVGKLNMLFDANSDDTGSGVVSIAANLTSNGGNITMGGGSGTIGIGSGFAFASPTATAALNQGVLVSSTVDAGGGNIIMNGLGNFSSNSYDLGISITGTVKTSGSGTINMNGTGGTYYYNPTGVSIAGTVSAVNGAINIVGQAGNASSGDDTSGEGIQVSGTVKTTGIGAITMIGTGGIGTGVGGGGNGSDNIGIENSAGTIQSLSGAITLTGTGGGSAAGPGSENYGVYQNGTVKSTSGDITIFGTGGFGTGGSNDGVEMEYSATDVGNSDKLTLRGATNSSGSVGLHVPGSIGNATTSGDIILLGDTFDFSGGPTIQTTGNMTIAPYTAGASLGIGTGSGTVQITDAILATLYWGSGKYLTVGSSSTGAMDINTAIICTRPVQVMTGSSGDITLDSNVVSSMTSGTSLVFDAGNHIINGGAYTISAGTGTARYLGYAKGNPSDNSFGSISNFTTVLGKAYASYGPGSVTETGNNVFFDNAAAGTLTFTANSISRFYGALNPVFTYTFSCSTGCTEAQAVTGLPSLSTLATQYSSVAGGPYTITISAGTLAKAAGYTGYTFSFVNGLMTILQKAIDITSLAGVNRQYDGTTSIALSGTAGLSGVVNSDVVSLTGTAAGSVVDKNVGANKTVTVSGLSLTGAAAGNYSLNPYTTTASITQKSLTAGLTGTVSRDYDGTNTATLAAGNYTLNGIVGTENVLLNNPASGTYNDKNAGTGKNVTVTGLSLSGTDVGNYTLASTSASNTIGTVLAKTLGVTADATSKTYGSVDPTLTYIYGTLATGDTASVFSGHLGRAAGENAGTYAETLGSLSAGGNYALSFTSADMTILQKAIDITSLAGVNRQYDGTTSIALSGTAGLSGVVNSDVVSLTGTAAGSVVDKNVGANKTVTVSGLSLTGAAAGNYSLNPYTTTASITQKSLTAGLTGTVSRDYDGTNTATLAAGNYTLNGIVGTENVLLNNPASGTYNDKNAGTGKNVTVTGLSLSGTDVGNYTLASTSASNTIGTVLAKTLGVTADATSKTYGSVDPTLTYIYGTLATGDTASVFSGHLGRAAGENAGTYAETLGSLSAGGNYALSFTSADMTILQKAIDITSLAGVNRQYDGTTSIALSGTAGLSGVVNSDVVSLTGTAAGSVVDKNVGANKTVTVSGLSLTGAAAGNYSLNPYTTTASITQKSLTAGLTGTVSRDYDGTNTATLAAGNYTLNGIVGTENVLLNNPASGTYNDKNAGTGKNVTVTGLSLSGTDVGNYTLASTSASNTIGTVLAKTLGVTADATSKTYGSVDPTLTYIYGTLATGDTASVFSGHLGRAAGENAGTYAETLGSLSAGGNYALSFTSADMTILQKAIDITSLAGVNRQYDGTTSIALSGTAGLSGVVNSDVVSLTGTAAGSVVDKNVGANKTVTVSGLSLTGAAAGNYSLNPYTTTASITQKSLTAGLTGTVSRDYDGTNTATLAAGNYTLNGIVGTENVLLNNPASGTYNDKNAGTGKNVTVTGLSLSGTDVGNYTLASTSASNTIGTVLAKTLGVTADATSKTYGSVDPTLTYIYGTLATGDTASVFSGHLGRAAGENAGTYAETLGSLSAGGNYALSFTSADMTILQKAIDITSLAGVNRQYDGTTSIALSGTAGLSGVVNSDVVSLTGTAAGSVVDKNVGANKTVTVSGLSLTGAAAGNYSLNPYTTTASITQKSLTAGLTGTVSKTYDGTNTATLASGNYTLSGIVGAENVLLNDPASGTYNDKNAGTGKNVTVSGLSLSGTDVGNYTLASTSASNTIGTVLAKTLGVTADATSKTYGSVDPTLTYSYGTLATGDTASVFSGHLGRAAGENVGTYAETLGTLNAGGNYALNFSSANLTINPADLTITADNITRLLGTTNPVLTAHYNGFKFSDNASMVSGLTLTTAADSSSPLGDYNIVAGGGSIANYVVHFVNGNLSVVDAIQPPAPPMPPAMVVPNTVTYSSQVPQVGPSDFISFGTDSVFGSSTTTDDNANNEKHSKQTTVNATATPWNSNSIVLKLDPALAQQMGMEGTPYLTF